MTTLSHSGQDCLDLLGINKPQWRSAARKGRNVDSTALSIDQLSVKSEDVEDAQMPLRTPDNCEAITATRGKGQVLVTFKIEPGDPVVEQGRKHLAKRLAKLACMRAMMMRRQRIEDAYEPNIVDYLSDPYSDQEFDDRWTEEQMEKVIIHNNTVGVDEMSKQATRTTMRTPKLSFKAKQAKEDKKKKEKQSSDSEEDEPTGDDRTGNGNGDDKNGDGGGGDDDPAPDGSDDEEEKEDPNDYNEEEALDRETFLYCLKLCGLTNRETESFCREVARTLEGIRTFEPDDIEDFFKGLEARRGAEKMIVQYKKRVLVKQMSF